MAALTVAGPRRPRRDRPGRAGVVVLAGVPARRRAGPAPARAHLGHTPGGPSPSTSPGLLDLERVRADAGRAGAVVGAGDGVGLPHDLATATCSTGWCAAPPGRRSPTSSGRWSPSRSAPTSTSACPTTALGPVRRPGPADRQSGIDYSALPEGNLLIPHDGQPAARRRRTAATAPSSARVSVAGISGHGNARSIARAQSVVSHGGEVDGVRLLSEATVDRIFEVQADGPDLVLMAPLRVGHRLPAAAAAVGAGGPGRPGRAGGPAAAARSSSTTSTAGPPSPTR